VSVGPARDASARPVAGRTAYVLLHNTSEIATCDASGERLLRYPRGAVVFQDGRVLEVGSAGELSRRHPDARPLNAGGRLVTPGLVDCHTHMIFAGQRAAEFQRRLAGERYEAIAAAGGGIRSTVAATARERDDTLEKLLANRLERWRANGCTSVEVKSGYGLTPGAEIRLLDLIRAASQRVPARVHRTALLHALPESHANRRADYLDELCERTLPEIRRTDRANVVDVFCDPVAFTVDECRRVLLRARELGFALRVHADQFERTGGAQLAAELSARSADHLEAANEDDWRALARSGTVGGGAHARAAAPGGHDAAQLWRALGDRDGFQSRHRARAVAARVRGAGCAAVRIQRR